MVEWGKAARGALSGVGLFLAVDGHAAESVATPAGPHVTPSVDVPVRYEVSAPDGHPAAHQDMRWQVASLRQRIDPEGAAVYMVTSWKDQTLTVVDTTGRRISTMPAPGARLTLPGDIPAGNFQRVGTDVVAGQACVLWRTADQDGKASDACYTDDGILVRVMQQGHVMVQAVLVERTPQTDGLFTLPTDFSTVAPVR